MRVENEKLSCHGVSYGIIVFIMALIRMHTQVTLKLKKKVSSASKRLSKGKKRPQGIGYKVSESDVVRLALESYFSS